MSKALICFWPFGIMMMAASGYTFIKDYNFRQRAVSTKGAIVGLEPLAKKHSSSKPKSAFPMIGFLGPDGKKITFYSNISVRTNINHYGEQVDVLYDPNNPRNAKINYQSIFLFYLVSFLMAMMGLAFTLTGSALLYLMHRDSKPQAKRSSASARQSKRYRDPLRRQKKR